MMAPPVQIGDRELPARARPVPFWRHGFLPPPLTSPRVLVACVPARLLARCMFTTSYSRCLRTGPSKVPAGRVMSPAGSLVWVTTGSVVGSAMFLLRLHRRAQQDDAAARAGNRAAHQHQVLGGTDRDDLDVLRRHAVGAVVTGHALVLEHAAREGAIADRAAVAEVLVRAVAGGKAAEAVPLDDAGVAASLGDAGHVDLVALLEQRLDGDLVAGGQRRGALVEAELAQHLEYALAGLHAVLARRLGGALRLLVTEADLDGRIAVA